MQSCMSVRNMILAIDEGETPDELRRRRPTGRVASEHLEARLRRNCRVSNEQAKSPENESSRRGDVLTQMTKLPEQNNVTRFS